MEENLPKVVVVPIYFNLEAVILKTATSLPSEMT
jgi:hypothetical protein